MKSYLSLVNHLVHLQYSLGRTRVDISIEKLRNLRNLVQNKKKMLTLFLCGVAAFCAFKFYLTFKPYFDLQQKTRHCDWAAFRLIGCDAYSE